MTHDGFALDVLWDGRQNGHEDCLLLLQSVQPTTMYDSAGYMIQTIPAGADSVYVTRTPLVLASASPRRKDFLASLGLAFSICPSPDSVEPQPEVGEDPDAYVRRAATAKAGHVHSSLSGHVILGAAAVLGVDTAVILDGAILGKPRDAAEALAFLRQLAGKSHQVITACALFLPDGQQAVFSVSSTVRMWDAPDEVLKAYAATPEPLDKAGGYAVQGSGAFLIASIDGSWSAVVGLPLAELVRLLLEREIIAPKAGGL